MTINSSKTSGISMILIDSRVTGYQTLIDHLTTPGEIFIIDAESDGVAQIASRLQGRSDMEALHIISHGSSGALYLGSTVLDSGNLSMYAPQLASIGSAMTQSGDLFLYGCNVAQGDAGVQFVNALAQATGADVAASSNATGATLLGGDQVLELVIGSLATTSLALEGLPGLLAITGQAIIDLGSYGKLINPVQVDGGKWYYFWDRSGDGTSYNTGSLHGGYDWTQHDVLDRIFNQDINGVVGGGGKTTDTYRYATINGVKLALPTVGGVTSPPYGAAGINQDQPGTAVGSATVANGSNAVNATYNDLLAVWDAYNGTGKGTGINGAPPGWPAYHYWSATPSASGHVLFNLNEGDVGDYFAYYDGGVALQVLDTGATPVITSAATASFAENGTGTVYTAMATDADSGTTLTYALAGTDVALFNINASTGVVTFKAAPNFEAPADAGANNVYDIIVTASDGVNTSAVKAVSVNITAANDVPTGSVTISGTAAQGKVLTASNTLADADGLGTISYQWKAGAVAISGATASTYTLTQADVGKAISVTASYTDLQGTPESMTSSATAHVVNTDNAATGTLNVSGSAKEGATLSASLSNLADADGSPSVAWQWQEQGSNGSWINLANKTLPNLIIPGDQSYIGKVVRVVATTTDPLGGKTVFTGSASSAIVSTAPVYSINADASSVNEGASVKFTLSTQNVASGTTLAFTLSGTGISGGDVDGGSLAGSMRIDASGQASVTVNLLADKLTEGAETLVFTVAGHSTSVTISDTSTTATTAAPGVVFTDAANLRTTEAGGKAQFKVALATAPRHDVVLTLTSNDATEGLFVSAGANGVQSTSTTQTLTFTPSNWSQTQTASLIGVDDAESDGNLAYVISTRVSSNDLTYDGMRSGQGIGVPNLFVENVDDDNPDEVSGTPGNDFLSGGPGPSDIYGFLGRDEMYGGKGDDRLYGGYGDDVLFGEDGNDSLEGEQGSDKLYGGSGKDSLTGGSGNDSLFGGDGDDVLDGQDGADSMDGGKGADTYYVDNPADVVIDSGSDGALDTVYIAAYLGSTYVMGKGIVNGTLSAQAGQGSLSGNASDNKLEGNSQNNTLVGGGGSDTLAGGGGADSIEGGEGNDTVVVTGNELDYTITTDTNKLLTYLTSKLGGEVTTVSSVEFVQFKDTLKSILSTVKGDMTAPTLSARSPTANAANVSSSTNVTLTFSEQVQAGSGTVVLKRAGAVDRSIAVSDINQVIFAGNTVVINPSEELAASASYTVELASGVIQDLSGNAYAGLSGYSFTTQAASSAVPMANQFVGLSNVKLVKDVAGNKSTVSFSITFNSASIDGQKVNGTLLDLDYDHSKVTSARVSGAQYESDGEATPVWQFITPNLQGTTANGKIVALANTDPANPIVVGGKTLDVTLGLNQAVDSFRIGFNKQSASVVTADGVDRAVGTAADVTAVPNQSYMLKASTLHWKNLAAGTAKALTDVSFVKGSQTLKSSSAGQAVFEASTDSQASMVVGKSVAESEKAAAAAAVNLTDAIAILKMIVGLNVNASGPLSPYQVVAADYNRDGGVGLTDAIDVLKAVVGLNAPAPSWVVLEQSKVESSMTMDSYNADKTKSDGWMSSTLSVDLDKTPEIQLVGVLAGDVDGSWAG